MRWFEARVAFSEISGPDESPYKGGIFELVVNIPDRYLRSLSLCGKCSIFIARYPFEPPKLRFLTPIYHPNIDSGFTACVEVSYLPQISTFSF